MNRLTAAAIRVPDDNELVIGAIILFLLMVGTSLSMGWLLSKLLSQPKRRKAFWWISTSVMIVSIIVLIALFNLFVF